GSLVELLEGKLSRAVMDVLARRNGGLFPEPPEISVSCSCPDWASMCKHVAATLYGIGARLDDEPELLFVLRKVDPAELIGRAAANGVISKGTRGAAGSLSTDDLGGLFGIELEGDENDAPATRASERRTTKRRATTGDEPKTRRSRASNDHRKASAS